MDFGLPYVAMLDWHRVYENVTRHALIPSAELSIGQMIHHAKQLGFTIQNIDILSIYI